MKKTQIDMSVLQLSEIVVYEFWYNYIKPIYGEKAKLCYMDTDSFILYIKTDDIHKDIAEDVETRFENSNCELLKQCLREKIKKVIGLVKDDLGGTITIKFVGLRVKNYSYLIDDTNGDKKAKGTKNCVMKKN